MKTIYLKISFYFTLTLLLSVAETRSQSVIPDSLLVGFDEDAALLELKEDKLDPDMIARFLDFKRREYAGKKAGTWNMPLSANDPLVFNKKGGNNSVMAAGCNNADFELGNFTGWNGAYGSCPSYFSNPCVPAANPICPNAGIITGRHTIMSGIGFDPWVGPGLPVVSQGGSYSVRIGNDDTGGEAEQLSTTFTVNQSHFSYRYAVVLENPNHTANIQPFFKIDVIETATGAPVTCAQYYVVSGAGVPGFRNLQVGYRDIEWKPWSTVTMDLSAYLGQQITIRFTTADCGAGGHFGYAYVDCYCEDLKVLQQDTVCHGDNAYLVAPDNFASYSWAPVASTAQTLVTNLPITHTVTMTTYSGCVTKAYHQLLTFPMPSAKFIFESDENDYSVDFTDQSSVAAPDVITSWNWQFGDGAESNEQHPSHTYAEGGSYMVQLAVQSENGCKDTVRQEVTVGSYTYYAPNAFTPNKDGINDEFITKGKGIKEFHIVIIDRWGNRLFESSDLYEPWKGTKKGSQDLCQQDVYVWKVYIKDLFENEYELTGHVALVQ